MAENHNSHSPLSMTNCHSSNKENSRRTIFPDDKNETAEVAKKIWHTLGMRLQCPEGLSVVQQKKLALWELLVLQQLRVLSKADKRV